MLANIGHESEQRDQNKRQPGKRHQPREIGADAYGVPTYYTEDAAARRRGSEQHRQQQIERANQGPSFMDRMYDGDQGRSRRQAPPAESKLKPNDHLNVFSWDDGKSGQVGGGPHHGKGHAVQRTDQQLQRLHPEDSDARRAREIEKFSGNTGGGFLKFSDADKPDAKRGPRVQQPQQQQQPRGRNGRKVDDSPNVANGLGGGGMLDNLMRGDGPAVQHKRRAPDRKGSNQGPEVAGFPGMGSNAPHKPFQHLPRKNMTSNVFLPDVGGDASGPTVSTQAAASRAVVEEQQQQRQRQQQQQQNEQAYRPPAYSQQGEAPATSAAENDDDDDGEAAAMRAYYLQLLRQAEAEDGDVDEEEAELRRQYYQEYVRQHYAAARAAGGGAAAYEGEDEEEAGHYGNAGAGQRRQMLYQGRRSSD